MSQPCRGHGIAYLHRNTSRWGPTAKQVGPYGEAGGALRRNRWGPTAKQVGPYGKRTHGRPLGSHSRDQLAGRRRRGMAWLCGGHSCARASWQAGKGEVWRGFAAATAVHGPAGRHRRGMARTCSGRCRTCTACSWAMAEG